MKKPLFLAIIALTALTGCAKNGSHNYYCQKITRQLHSDTHRHSAGRKLTPIGEARLMKEYKQYRCKMDERER